MNILIIFNTLINVFFIGLILYKWNPIYIEINRTYWMKKIISFTLWYRTSKYSAKGIFTIPIRDWEKWDAWDFKQYHNGNYSKYKEKQKQKKTKKK